MANINLQPFSEQVARVFASGLSNTEFAAELLQAVNGTINEINQQADTETEIARVASLTATVTLDVRYQNMLLVGVIYWLAVFSRRPRGADQKNLPPLSQLRDEFERSIAMYAADLRNDLDPDEDDIVGLGVCEN